MPLLLHVIKVKRETGAPLIWLFLYCPRNGKQLFHCSGRYLPDRSTVTVLNSMGRRDMMPRICFYLSSPTFVMASKENQPPIWLSCKSGDRPEANYGVVAGCLNVPRLHPYCPLPAIYLTGSCFCYGRMSDVLYC